MQPIYLLFAPILLLHSSPNYGHALFYAKMAPYKSESQFLFLEIVCQKKILGCCFLLQEICQWLAVGRSGAQEFLQICCTSGK